MFKEKQICSNCKTGKESYELDTHSENCPYMMCWSNGRCDYYKPLKKPLKLKLFKRADIFFAR